MKKTYILVCLLILAGILITSCEPQEVLPFCKEACEEQLAIYPDFPPSFIGYCVASLQTGKPTGYQGLCSSSSFREALVDMDENVTEVLTRRECILYFQEME